MMEYYAHSACGLVKENNEDYYTIGNKAFYEETISCTKDESFFCVFDGVGGNIAGEVASRLASEFYAKKIYQLTDDIESTLRSLTMKCNELIVKESANESRFKGMATTVAGLFLNDNDFICFNLGDSRVYRYRFGILNQFSQDDSLSELYKNIGRYTESKMAENNHVITSYLGKLDLIDNDIHIDNVESGVLAGDIFLVATDGLTDMLSPNEISNIFDMNVSLEEKGELLNIGIINAGSLDNYTYIIIQV